MRTHTSFLDENIANYKISVLSFLLNFIPKSTLRYQKCTNFLQNLGQVGLGARSGDRTCRCEVWDDRNWSTQAKTCAHTHHCFMKISLIIKFPSQLFFIILYAKIDFKISKMYQLSPKSWPSRAQGPFRRSHMSLRGMG